MEDGQVKQILKKVWTSFITVPELKFFGKIILAMFLIGIAFLIVKLLT